MAIRINNEDDAIADINITPFVDVVLVLLVIFMVTAHFIVNRGMNLQLPKAANVEQIKKQKNFNVALSRDGSLSLDGHLISLSQMKESVQKSALSQQDVVVTLSADKGVIYDSVIHVMDELRQVGIANFALQLEPETK
jgi:biopolymer transport protein ExbD